MPKINLVLERDTIEKLFGLRHWSVRWIIRLLVYWSIPQPFFIYYAEKISNPEIFFPETVSHLRYLVEQAAVEETFDEVNVRTMLQGVLSRKKLNEGSQTIGNIQLGRQYFTWRGDLLVMLEVRNDDTHEIQAYLPLTYSLWLATTFDFAIGDEVIVKTVILTD